MKKKDKEAVMLILGLNPNEKVNAISYICSNCNKYVSSKDKVCKNCRSKFKSIVIYEY